MSAPRRTTLIVRAGVAIAAGVAVLAVALPLLGLAAALVAGWAALAMTTTVWTVVTVWPMDAAATRSHAVTEDPGRSVAALVAVIGSVASLGAVGIVLIQTGERSEAESYLLAAIAVVSVAASWTLIQTDYMLRVARIYYSEPVGGIDFNQSDDPTYSDFAYFSLGIGMGYQVGDTSVRTNQIRRLVIGQALLAYLFGAVIIGTVVNLVLDLG
ncbi:DUF1345 domain-containing protein [Planococcus sp. APC 4015]|nr:DUF1345 domain-containing protein [Planococcus sp. APC 4015]